MERFLASEEARPTIAFIASLVGAILILGDGAFLVIIGSAVSSVGYIGAGNALGGLGFLGAFLGFIVLVLAMLLFRNPDSHVGYGIAILVFSLLSLISGGGFIIGTIAGVIGGILAIVFEPDEEPLPWGPNVGPVSSTGSRCPNCSAVILSGSLLCPDCGLPVTR